MESAYELVPRKRPFTSGIEAVKDVLAFAFFRRDWVGVQCTACDAYALQAYIGYKIEKNALDGCPGIEKEGRFQRRKAMGRYRL